MNCTWKKKRSSSSPVSRGSVKLDESGSRMVFELEEGERAKKRKKWSESLSILSSDEEELAEFNNMKPESSSKFDSSENVASRFPYPMFNDDSAEEDLAHFSNEDECVKENEKSIPKLIVISNVNIEKKNYKHTKRKKGDREEEEEHEETVCKPIVDKNKVTENLNVKSRKSKSKALDKIVLINTTEKEFYSLDKNKTNGRKVKSRNIISSTSSDSSLCEDSKSDTRNKRYSKFKNQSERYNEVLDPTSAVLTNENSEIHLSGPGLKSTSRFLDSSDENSEIHLSGPGLKSTSRFLDSSDERSNEFSKAPFKSKVKLKPKLRRLHVLSTSSSDDEESKVWHGESSLLGLSEKSGSKLNTHKGLAARNSHLLSSTSGSDEEKDDPSKQSSMEENLSSSHSTTSKMPFENLLKTNEIIGSQQPESEQINVEKTNLQYQPTNVNGWKNIAKAKFKPQNPNCHRPILHQLKKHFISCNKPAVEIHKKISQSLEKLPSPTKSSKTDQASLLINKTRVFNRQVSYASSSNEQLPSVISTSQQNMPNDGNVENNEISLGNRTLPTVKDRMTEHFQEPSATTDINKDNLPIRIDSCFSLNPDEYEKTNPTGSFGRVRISHLDCSSNQSKKGKDVDQSNLKNKSKKQNHNKVQLKSKNEGDDETLKTPTTSTCDVVGSILSQMENHPFKPYKKPVEPTAAMLGWCPEPYALVGPMEYQKSLINGQTKGIGVMQLNQTLQAVSVTNPDMFHTSVTDIGATPMSKPQSVIHTNNNQGHSEENEVSVNIQLQNLDLEESRSQKGSDIVIPFYSADCNDYKLTDAEEKTQMMPDKNNKPTKSSHLADESTQSKCRNITNSIFDPCDDRENCNEENDCNKNKTQKKLSGKKSKSSNIREMPIKERKKPHVDQEAHIQERKESSENRETPFYEEKEFSVERELTIHEANEDIEGRQKPTHKGKEFMEQELTIREGNEDSEDREIPTHEGKEDVEDGEIPTEEKPKSTEVLLIDKNSELSDDRRTHTKGIGNSHHNRRAHMKRSERLDNYRRTHTNENRNSSDRRAHCKDRNIRNRSPQSKDRNSYYNSRTHINERRNRSYDRRIHTKESRSFSGSWTYPKESGFSSEDRRTYYKESRNSSNDRRTYSSDSRDSSDRRTHTKENRSFDDSRKTYSKEIGNFNDDKRSHTNDTRKSSEGRKTNEEGRKSSEPFMSSERSPLSGEDRNKFTENLKKRKYESKENESSKTKRSKSNDFESQSLLSNFANETHFMLNPHDKVRTHNKESNFQVTNKIEPQRKLSEKRENANKDKIITMTEKRYSTENKEDQRHQVSEVPLRERRRSSEDRIAPNEESRSSGDRRPIYEVIKSSEPSVGCIEVGEIPIKKSGKSIGAGRVKEVEEQRESSEPSTSGLDTGLGCEEKNKFNEKRKKSKSRILFSKNESKYNVNSEIKSSLFEPVVTKTVNTKIVSTKPKGPKAFKTLTEKKLKEPPQTRINNNLYQENPLSTQKSFIRGVYGSGVIMKDIIPVSEKESNTTREVPKGIRIRVKGNVYILPAKISGQTVTSVLPANASKELTVQNSSSSIRKDFEIVTENTSVVEVQPPVNQNIQTLASITNENHDTSKVSGSDTESSSSSSADDTSSSSSESSSASICKTTQQKPLPSKRNSSISGSKELPSTSSEKIIDVEGCLSSSSSDDVIIVSGPSIPYEFKESTKKPSSSTIKEESPSSGLSVQDRVECTGSSQANTQFTENVGKIRVRSLKDLGVDIDKPLPANALLKTSGTPAQQELIIHPSVEPQPSALLTPIPSFDTVTEPLVAESNKRSALVPQPNGSSTVSQKNIPVRDERESRSNPSTNTNTNKKALQTRVVIFKPVNVKKIIVPSNSNASQENPLSNAPNRINPLGTPNPQPPITNQEVMSQSLGESRRASDLQTCSVNVSQSGQDQPKTLTLAVVLAPEDTAMLFFKLYDELFTELVRFKIPQLVDDLHLAIAYDILREERIKKIDNLISPQTRTIEKRRAEKEFNDMLKIRGQSFVPLFMTIVNKINKNNLRSFVTALYCRIVHELERIDPSHIAYRYKLRHIIKALIQRHCSGSKDDICKIFDESENSFVSNYLFIEDLLVRYDKFNNSEERRKKNTTNTEANTAPSGQIHNHPQTNIQNSSSSSDRSNNFDPSSMVNETSDLPRPRPPTPPPIGNLDQMLFMKKNTAGRTLPLDISKCSTEPVYYSFDSS